MGHYIDVYTETFPPDSAVPREPIVLFVGRLVEKGVRDLNCAMSRAQAIMPEVELE